MHTATESKACFGLMYHPDQPGHQECPPQECVECHLFQPCMTYITARALRKISDDGVQLNES